MIIIIMDNMEYLEPIFYMLIGIFCMLFMIFWQVDKIYDHITIIKPIRKPKSNPKYNKYFKKHLSKHLNNDFQWKKTNQPK